jgi:aminoglycoside phosphotransferase (APT) family kinase protein
MSSARRCGSLAEAETTDLPLALVARWLRAAGVDVALPLTAELIAGGRSNLTYLLTDPTGTRLVLRRPPLSGVIASAHDVLREGRIMAALAGAAVPVPAVVATCSNLEILGAPFIVMSWVDGVVLRDRSTAEATLPAAARAAVGPGLVDALVALHDVAPAEVGLADLGKGSGYVERQLTRWAGQLDKLGVAAGPRMRELHARLQAEIPTEAGTTLVHGDYRPGNAIVGPNGTLRAILDWELATLGDPLADVGWFVAYWGDPDVAGALPMSVPTSAAGFGSARQVADRYAERSGRSLADLDYYIAFALWRLAAILTGVQARARQGAYGRVEGAAIATVSGDERIDQLLILAAAATERAGR